MAGDDVDFVLAPVIRLSVYLTVSLFRLINNSKPIIMNKLFNYTAIQLRLL